MDKQKRISIIVPTLNEADSLAPFLDHISQLGADEIIIADGQSIDETVKIAQSYTVVQSERGRAVQMNTGARVAMGDVFWFVHADCYPHKKSVDVIRDSLSQSGVIGGAFEYNLNAPGFRYRLVEYLSNKKNHRLGLVYGDMGIFVDRKMFFELRGYQNIPLMEDMDFCKRMKQQGKIVILPYRINTSARRWIEEGYFKNFLRNWMLQLAWAAGVSPFTLARYYKFGS
jgi:rSAM/selenodomain-associated transferase 2